MEKSMIKEFRPSTDGVFRYTSWPGRWDAHPHSLPSWLYV